MYMVVSKWEIIPGKEDVVEREGRQMREYLRSLDGVEFVETFRAEDGSGIAVLGYRDEDTYRRIIQDPEGPFEKRARELRLEDNMRWVWSERGETVDSAVQV